MDIEYRQKALRASAKPSGPFQVKEIHNTLARYKPREIKSPHPTNETPPEKNNFHNSNF